ncbi:RDD family protein [Lysobacter claricitrinus]|uniref:RDD family protein n=1 Tax=Lysobacter claricitrinus TaxID=3367728 RepID=UPI0037DB05E5
MTQDNGGGREWRPYEIATPIVREGAAASPPPLPPGLERSPYAAPHAAVVAYASARATNHAALASLGKRLGAALIDIGLWVLPLLLVLKAAMHVYRMTELGQPASSAASMSSFAFAGFLWLGLAIWNIVWMAQHAQTVGKRFVGIRVVRSDGSPVGFWRLLLLRGVAMNLLCNLAGRAVPAASTVLWLVDVLFIFGEERRCLHDRIADTIVVDA